MNKVINMHQNFKNFELNFCHYARSTESLKSGSNFEIFDLFLLR